MSLESIQAEFLESGIGSEIYDGIVAAARRILPRYDPQVYLRSSKWDDALEDFIQEFVCNVLIEEGQLQYAVENAADESHFWRLIIRQMRRFLARRRERTVVDNLLDRAREVVTTPPFAFEGEGITWRFWLADSPPPEAATMDERAILATAARVAAFEVVRSEGSERASTVYTTGTLRQILMFVAAELPCKVSLRSLDTIFRRALTFLLPSNLSIDEGGAPTLADHGIDAESRLRVEEAAAHILARLSSEERMILKMKIGNQSDTEVAAATNVSRPTVDKRKKEAMKKVAFAVEDLEEKLQVLVIDRVATVLLGEM